MPTRGTASKRPGIGVVVLLVLVLAVGAPGAAAAAGTEAGFCETKTLHDYLTPLKGMPKLRERPFRARSEPLFRGVRIGASGPSLAVNGGSAGYQLQWDENPGWDITVTLAQVRRDGSTVEELGRRRVRLGALAPALVTEPHFALPGRPAFYRTTLAIQGRSGRKVAEFGNYYRVVRPRIDIRLVPEAPSYRPGETLMARLENPGTAFALLAEESTVEGLQGESWGPVPDVPAISTPLQFVAPGTTSARCVTFTIPASMPPGQYRLANETVISWPSDESHRRPELHAEFEVTAGA
jgi:hypothetical protein